MVSLYIFNVIPFNFLIHLFFGLTITIGITWLVIVYLMIKYPKFNDFKVFVIAFVFIFVLRGLFFSISTIFNLPEPPLKDKYLLYPLLTSLAINIIVQVVAKSVINAYKVVESEQKLQKLKLENTEAQKQITP